jgi:hypothetical protein
MRSIAITVTAAESDHAEFRDVVNFLWDFNLLFEISRLAVDPKYEGFRFSNRVYQRNGRPVDHRDRLRLVSLTEESPLRLKTVATATAGAAAALWVLVQSAQTIENWPLQRKKLELEVRKTELEIEKLEREAPPELRGGQKRVEFGERESKRRAREIEKIEKQLARPRIVRPWTEVSPELAAFQGQLESRGAAHQVFSVIERFERSPMRIEDVRVELVDEEER